MTIYALTGCLDGLVYYVDFDVPGPIPLDQNAVYSFSSSSETICGTLISTYQIPIATTTYQVIQQETDCFSCLDGLGIASLVFTSCTSSDVYDISLGSFLTEGFLPTLGLVYSFDVTPAVAIPQLCKVFSGTSNVVATYTLTPQVSYPSYTDCGKCAERGRIVTINGCDGFTYYAEVPAGTLVGDLILFTPIGEYFEGYFCGVVDVDAPREVPTINFITNYGDNFDCEYCTTGGENPGGYTRRTLTSCLDGSTIVVDVSSLYSVGQSTFVSVDGGSTLSSCFEIGEETNDPLTYSVQIGYEPRNGCQDCIDCNGAYFEFSACTGGTYNVFTRQYINLNTSTTPEFYNDPLYGCGSVNFYYLGGNLLTSAIPINRVATFSSCTECDSYTPQLWLVQGCGAVNTPLIMDMTNFSATTAIGQVYKYELINIDSPFCFSLLNEYTDPYSNITQLDYLPLTSSSYTDCDSCIATTDYAIVIVECGTSDFQIVNIPGVNFNEIIQFINDNGSVVIKDGVGRCYTPVTEFCVFESTLYPTFSPYSLHLDCESCNIPFSAGTPTGICVICCPCTTGTTINQIYGPNPTWTNQQGYGIVLLDAIVLGGPNGWNN